MDHTRIRRVNDQEARPGSYVLYWMISARRTRFSFALEHALDRCREHGVPLLVLEGLRVGHQYAADRHHQFVLDGMRDNRRALEAAGVRALTYVERQPGEGRGLLTALARDAACVVTDYFPGYFLPRMVEAAGRALPVRLEMVDGNGLLPIFGVERTFTRAHSFRRHLQKVLPGHLAEVPLPEPLDGYDLGRAVVDAETVSRWQLDAPLPDPGTLPIDHTVPTTPGQRGGAEEARRRWRAFLELLPEYGEERNHPDSDCQSNLSPYLHYGQIGTHELVHDLLLDWDIGQLGPVTGSREGWWGIEPASEAFLDQVITWRELGYVSRSQDAMGYDDLPAWAHKTIAEHAADPRPVVYDLDTLESAATEDPIWNAAQRQLVTEGRIHNYLRMLWGKKVLQWSPSAREAFSRLDTLNDRYALDGRDPNSRSGIGWVFGRFDRAWGPVRPIFGKLRYMTSDSAKRKLRMNAYLRRWS